MIHSDQLAMLAAATLALMLASQRFNGFRLSLEVKVWMALAWALIIVGVTLIAAHVQLPGGAL